jgi:hypothetical protein
MDDAEALTLAMAVLLPDPKLAGTAEATAETVLVMTVEPLAFGMG